MSSTPCLYGWSRRSVNLANVARLASCSGFVAIFGLTSEGGCCRRRCCCCRSSSSMCWAAAVVATDDDDGLLIFFGAAASSSSSSSAAASAIILGRFLGAAGAAAAGAAAGAGRGRTCAGGRIGSAPWHAESAPMTFAPSNVGSRLTVNFCRGRGASAAAAAAAAATSSCASSSSCASCAASAAGRAANRNASARIASNLTGGGADEAGRRLNCFHILEFFCAATL